MAEYLVSQMQSHLGSELPWLLWPQSQGWSPVAPMIQHSSQLGSKLIFNFFLSLEWELQANNLQSKIRSQQTFTHNFCRHLETQRTRVCKSYQFHSLLTKSNTFALAMNIYDKRKVLLFLKVLIQMCKVPVHDIFIRYDFLQKGKKNRLASTLSIAIQSCFHGNHKCLLPPFEYQIFETKSYHSLIISKTANQQHYPQSNVQHRLLFQHYYFQK